jgi:serralysin
MRTRLDRRSQAIESYAHFQLEPLERRVLLSTSLFEWSPPANPTVATETVISTDTSTSSTAPYSLSNTFALHSNSGAAHSIYLDFDGHVTSGTSWNSSFNGGADIVTSAYDFDGDTSTFSSLELERIAYIFDRVATDFMPFDVDVTTEAPLLDGLVKSGSSDAQWGVRVVIGGASGDWFGTSAGGVAYYDSFNWSSDTPAFVFEKQLGNGNEKYTAEAISHEVGHTLNLRHDGASGTEYYQGTGSGETGWAPIMGVGYYKNLTQWSRGEYLDANNTQDDLAIITTNNGFDYRNDDFGSYFAAATVLLGSGGVFQSGGIIERNTDVDVFSFLTGGGSINIDIFADGRSPNLDVMAQLYDDSFTLLAASNPANLLNASIATAVGAGTYFLAVSGTGKGDPLNGGYSDYASLGQYTISGQVVDAGPMLAVNDVTVNEADGMASLTVSLSQAMTEAVSVDVQTADGSAVAGSDYTAVTQTLSFEPGQTVRTISIPIVQDSLIESAETFGVRLSNASTNVTIADDYGVANILDDDVSVSIADASLHEGNLGKGKKQTLKTTDMVFTVSLSGASDSVITVAFETAPRLSMFFVAC